MRKILISAVLFASLAGVYSCKGKKANTDESTSATTTTDSAAKPAAITSSPEKTNETKTYTVTATPDSAILGKNKEALIKVKNLKAIQLNDPNGKDTGIELSYDIEVTNKNKVGGDNVYLNPSQFRLLLDNGTKVTHDNYNSASVDAESTKTSTDNKFKLPPGTKPKALNLFYNETSASINLNLK
ncbi:MAG: hypothetical protein V5804_03175 [Mucilaginibacter sp.]|uniref:hypothetical protein n=1 Tax=Mucilaginibacter sp. TaxID=1882438 RepID=UPI0034E568FC